MEAVFPAVQFEDETRLQSGAVTVLNVRTVSRTNSEQASGSRWTGGPGMVQWELAAGAQVWGATSWALEGGFVVEAAGPRVQTTAALQERKMIHLKSS